MPSPAGRIRHGVTRIEEALWRRLGRVSGGGGSGGDGFVPWQPLTAEEQARWDRESGELRHLPSASSAVRRARRSLMAPR